MNLLRDPEIKKELLVFLLLTVLLAGGLCFFSLWAGALALGGGLLFTGMHLLCLSRRCRDMETLSRELDAILHGQQELLLYQYKEGELSILLSQIRKMTLMLREQTEALTRDKEQLARSMADISHQLRTPLTSLHMSVALLSREDLSRQEALELLHGIKIALNRMDWLIEALLKMAKLEAGTAAFRADKLFAFTLMQKALEPLRIPLELRDISLHMQAGQEAFTGDLLWSAEALGNVLKNCMEHTPDGGSITLRARETALFTEITVQDTGKGFAAEDIPHLFERFYRGQNAGEESIGIGLALARMVMTWQNGTIQARNAPEGGALFTLRFYKSVV